MSIPKASSAVVACAMMALACGPDGPLAPGSDDGSLASGPQSDADPAAASAEVLVFGQLGDENERDQLAAVLTGLGHTVENTATLPSDLSPYDVIWHVAFNQALTPEEQDGLAGFLADGGGVHLTGEQPSGGVLNESLEPLVNDLVAGGGITVGGLGHFFEFGFTFRPSAVGGITTSPNALEDWAPMLPGGMDGVPAENVLVTHDASGTPNGAAWECASLVGGAGQLTILMDFDWLDVNGNPQNSPGLRDPQIENIQTFLQRPCGQAVPAVVEVDIDIKPGGSPNSINVVQTDGVTPVAVLGSEDFDVRDLDPATLEFGDLAEGESTGPAHQRGGHFEDVNRDGFEDLVMHFATADTGIDPGDTEACMAGETTSGTPVHGCDSVRTVPSGGSARRGP